VLETEGWVRQTREEAGSREATDNCSGDGWPKKQPNVANKTVIAADKRWTR